MRWIAVLLAASIAVSVLLGFVGADDGVGWRHFNWDLAAVAGTAIGTIALAGFTGALAWTTSGDVRATWELARLTREDQDARETPVVIVEVSAYKAADPENALWGGSQTGTLYMSVTNAGLGPALDVRVSGASDRGETVREQVVAILAPGDRANITATVSVDQAALPDPNDVGTFHLRGTYSDRRGGGPHRIRYIANGVWADSIE